MDPNGNVLSSLCSPKISHFPPPENTMILLVDNRLQRVVLHVHKLTFSRKQLYVKVSEMQLQFEKNDFNPFVVLSI